MKRFYIYLTCIVILAFLLRFYKLGIVPHGITWDEAAIGYNGYASITTRRDEWLEFLPVSFKSFGDYKAPFAIYLTGLFVTLLGSSAFVIRLPFALFGVAAVLGMILLAKELFKKDSLALLAGFLLALSPWHLHFSRTGFESGMAMTMIIWGLLFFFLFIKKRKFAFLHLLLSGFLFILSLYTYHSSKIVAPALGILLLLFYRKELLKKAKDILLASPIFLAALYPLIKDSLFGEGLERAGTMIFFKNLSTAEIVQTLFSNTAAHISLDFLIGGGSTTLRHSNGAWGVLFATSLSLFTIGLATPIFRKKIKKVWVFLLLWIIIGFLPAIFTDEIPHPNRALLALPAMLLVSVMAIKNIETCLKYISNKLPVSKSYIKQNMLAKAVFGILFLLHISLFLAYRQFYFTEFSANSADAFADGYLEAFQMTQDYKKGENGKPKVNNIVFTDEYGQAYIFELFVARTNPIWYRGGTQNIYMFESVDIGDLSRQNTLVVAGLESGLDERKADAVVYGSDNRARFQFYYLP